MAAPGPRKIKRYPDDFKVSAVKMSHEPGVLIKDVAESLCIHPFMLSLWHKQVRDGTLKGVAAEVDEVSTSELKRLRELEKKYKLLEQEHDLLKKPFGLFPIQVEHLRLHRSKPSNPPGPSDVCQVRSVTRWLLSLAKARCQCPCQA